MKLTDPGSQSTRFVKVLAMRLVETLRGARPGRMGASACLEIEYDGAYSDVVPDLMYERKAGDCWRR